MECLSQFYAKLESMTTGRKTRGAALATAILLTLLLLTLGMSFLTFCQRDLQFQRRQQNAAQAQNLALAGIEYFRYLDNKTPSVAPVMGDPPIVVEVVPDLEEFEIERVQIRDYVSRGRVMDGNGNILAERVICVPAARMENAYETRL